MYYNLLIKLRKIIFIDTDMLLIGILDYQNVF